MNRHHHRTPVVVRFGWFVAVAIALCAAQIVLLVCVETPAWVTTLSAVAILCVGIGGYCFLYRPHQQRLRQFERRIRAFRQQMFIETADNPTANLPAMEQAMDELSQKVKRELIKLRDIDVFRREFIGDVSHELRTPLFAVQGYIETLLDGALDDKQVNRKFMRQAQKNVDRLITLVNDLLVISQLESGELKMNPQPFRIYEAVLDVFELLEIKLTLKGRNIRLQLLANGNENTYVNADKDRIKQVLVNLIDNAIKYGRPDGTVDVILRQDEGKLLVSVRDNGPGIAEDHLPLLFNRFYRIDKSRSRENGGTGLGLAIVKFLIEAHDENITVSSKQGVGTTFTFGLQL